MKKRLFRLLEPYPEGFRLKKGQEVGWIRVQLLELLEKEGPMDAGTLAFKLGRSYESVRSHLRVLLAGGYVCDEVVNINKPRTRMWTVCPRCPVEEECKIRDTKVWGKA